MRKIAFILLLLIASPALAQVQPPPQPAAPPAAEPDESKLMQAFVDKATEPCETKPAQVCVDLAWQFAVSQPKQGMTVADLKRLRARLGTWYDWHQKQFPAKTRGSIALGMLMADGMTMERLFAAFDTDHNGLVTQKELLADVKMDNRPLGVVLSDPNAVDRAGFARRLGLPPMMTDGFFQGQKPAPPPVQAQ
jgi:hypothetical protein